MEICHTHTQLSDSIKILKQQGKKIAMVPTMGALHEGHLSLVRLAKDSADIVVCSIFVNPTQFTENEDFGDYPRKEAKDIELLAGENIDIIYLPSVQDIYPENEEVAEPPIINGNILEGEFRPHFFRGVGIVVTKLLQYCAPEIAFFGEKDYQQLHIIKQMVKLLNLPIEIVGGQTQRDFDGLALSSRNSYLSKNERKIAPVLYQTINHIFDCYQQGENAADLIADGKEKILQAGFKSVDYLEIRDVQTLSTNIENNPRVLVAATLGNTRLIDNV